MSKNVYIPSISNLAEKSTCFVQYFSSVTGRHVNQSSFPPEYSSGTGILKVCQSQMSNLQMTCRRQFFKNNVSQSQAANYVCVRGIACNLITGSGTNSRCSAAGVHSAHKHCFAMLSACIATAAARRERATADSQSVIAHCLCTLRLSFKCINLKQRTIFK